MPWGRLNTIEAAAFVVYLDEARPQNANERAYQFLHANGFNRWDKGYYGRPSLLVLVLRSFVICL